MKKQKELFPMEYQEWQNNPSQENTTKLLTKLNPIIDKAIFSYGGGNKNLSTRAKINTVNLLQQYDPSKNIQLNTYLYSGLQKLNRVNRERSNVIHLPENIYYNKKKIKDARQKYIERYHKEPDDSYLADKIGMSIKQIKTADSYLNNVNDTAVTSEKGDLMNHPDKSPEDMWIDYVYFDADDKSKKILEWSTGYNGSKVIPKKDIAKKLKMTPAAVSIRINKLKSQLQEGSSYEQ